MSDDNYTLKELLTELKLDMREHGERTVRMEETLNSVLTQALKTNGRVSKSEADILEVKTDLGKWKVAGATLATVAGVIWTGVTFIVPNLFK